MKVFNFSPKRERKRTLGDFDKLTLCEISSDETPLPVIEDLIEKSDYCDKYRVRIIAVKPIIQMVDMILCECEKCKERVYRKP